MIAQLTGTIVDAHVGHVVVDVAGVGYLVAVRSTESFTIGNPITLFTYLAVRETALDLYGFNTMEERQMFELLLSVPKVGPKSAMQILSQADIALLEEAAARADATYLTKMSGIGKKTAEKIITELKDKLDVVSKARESALHQYDDDCIDALVALGYPAHAAREALKQISTDTTSTSARVTAALKILGGGR